MKNNEMPITGKKILIELPIIRGDAGFPDYQYIDPLSITGMRKSSENDGITIVNFTNTTESFTTERIMMKLHKLTEYLEIAYQVGVDSADLLRFISVDEMGRKGY
jgi:hypothetical protein